MLNRQPDAAILCGGLGTRLRDTLRGLPKALAPIDGQPFLERLVATLVGAQIERIVLCVGVGASAIRDHFRAGNWGAEIVFSEEASPQGTGGALGWARAHLHTNPVLVLNGDSLVEGLDFQDFARSHHQHAAAGSLVVVPQDGRADTGMIRLDSAGRVRQFSEKEAVAGASFQSAGIYLLTPPLLEMIPPSQPSSLERDCMPRWIEAGMQGYVQVGELVDIGTPDRLSKAQAQWARSRD